MADGPLRGSVLSLTLFDVCEETDLARLGTILGAPRVGTTFKPSAPEYVRFERPPVEDHVGDVSLSTGDRVQASLRFYDYGVVGVTLERPFSGSWDELLTLAKNWIWNPTFETDATAVIKERIRRAAPAFIKPYARWLTEDYFVFHISQIEKQPTSERLTAECGEMIARIVRGEPGHLSKGEVSEVLQSSISYYPNDLAVIGWNAAFVYDAAGGGDGTIQLLEYANSQLLEFRHYDELLTEELQRVYHLLDRGTGMVHRWKLAREATRLNTVRLEITEIAERADNLIKFLSDMFAARLYRLAAVKIGVPDYKGLVNSKLRTTEELYEFMVDEFHQGRAFVLEMIVIVILVIELLALFLHKPR